MALDFLTVRAMWAECERLFSATGRMVTPERASLDSEMIAVCQFLRSWYRVGVVSTLDPILTSMDQDDANKKLEVLSDKDFSKRVSRLLHIDEGEINNIDEANKTGNSP